MKEVKKKFLKKVNQISSDIFTMREQEIGLKTKESKLIELESAFNRMSMQSSFDYGKLKKKNGLIVFLFR